MSGYGFLVTATDGQESGGGGVDRFRIKIRRVADAANYSLMLVGGDTSRAELLGDGAVEIVRSAEDIVEGVGSGPPAVLPATLLPRWLGSSGPRIHLGVVRAAFTPVRGAARQVGRRRSICHAARSL